MNWLRNFMYGRYGGDQLTIFLLVVSMILTIIPLLVVRIISLVLIALVFFRILSKNIAQRQKENIAFLNIWYPVKNFFVHLFKGRPDQKTHKHFKCPKCKQQVRVPRGKGTINITCPKCNTVFQKRT